MHVCFYIFNYDVDSNFYSGDISFDGYVVSVSFFSSRLWNCLIVQYVLRDSSKAGSGKDKTYILAPKRDDQQQRAEKSGTSAPGSVANAVEEETGMPTLQFSVVITYLHACFSIIIPLRRPLEQQRSACVSTGDQGSNFRANFSNGEVKLSTFPFHRTFMESLLALGSALFLTCSILKQGQS